MPKVFRPWDVEQVWLLPPSIQQMVPEGHVAHFVRETVRESLDLSGILESYGEERGQPPYHPAMMTALLLYAYSQGVYSSRGIARACEERVDFMAVTAMQRPDFRTIAEFRRRHLKALSSLFLQVVRLCRRAGLVRLGHVALDGTKIRANASKHKAMSYGRMDAEEKRLEAEVKSWLAQAEQMDRREDKKHGPELRGDELPDWVKSKQLRLQKIREAKAALEAEAREKQPPPSQASGPPGRPGKHPAGVPRPEAQRNFTDPESRIMMSAEGFQQCYNAQAAVDGEQQVIVACGLTQSATDRHQLVPLIDQIRSTCGCDAREVSADSDYCTEEALATLEQRGIRGYVATGKQQHGKGAPIAGRKVAAGGPRDRMRRRLKLGGHRSRYRFRKQVVEPVYGQIKAARGFRQFLLRGVEKVTAEWSLVCSASNLLKLYRAAAV